MPENRSELSEIETALCAHAGVREAAAVLHEDGPGGPRIVAYAVPASTREPLEPGLAGQQVSQWQMIFDRAYEDGEDSDPTFNIAGWTSTYTGQPIPAGEMREWVDSTVERILARQPDRVLEIGCGTGLLLCRIAPCCSRYWATDLSPAAIGQLRPLAAALPGVRLFEREAADFSSFPEGSFDAVVLNSVAQYFPGADYLVRVVEEAVRAVRDGGFVFLGDLRSLPLLDLFQASVELERAPASLPLHDVRQRVRARAAEEGELAVDPGLFPALARHLPRIGGVRISVKRGRASNELTRFRYDVVLEVGGEAPAAEARRLAWTPEMDPGHLRRLLEEERPEALIVTGAPNGRLARDLAAARQLWQGDGDRTVGELRDALGPPEGIDPEEVWELAEEVGYAADVSWHGRGEDGRLDLLLWRGETPKAPSPLFGPPAGETASGWSAWANDPLAARHRAQLLPRLREHLRERLPEPLVPAALVLLEALPRTPEGELDRGALLGIEITGHLETLRSGAA